MLGKVDQEGESLLGELLVLCYMGFPGGNTGLGAANGTAVYLFS